MGDHMPEAAARPQQWSGSETTRDHAPGFFATTTNPPVATRTGRSVGNEYPVPPSFQPCAALIAPRTAKLLGEAWALYTARSMLSISPSAAYAASSTNSSSPLV